MELTGVYIDDQPRIVLEWETGPAAGLEVAVHVHSQAAAVAAERFTARLRADRVRERDVAELAAVFIDHVLEWSIRDRFGEPVPVELGRFLRLHKDVVVQPVLQQWVLAVRNPPTLTEPAVEPPVEPPAAEAGPVAGEPWAQEPDDWEPETYPDIEQFLSVQNLTAPLDTDELVAAHEGG